jgi:two-component system, NtrC family, response regulator HupR/HoxA
MLGYDSLLTVQRTKVKQWLRPSETGREVRLPLHVRVLTRPNYGESWSLNLSSGGMALGVAQPSGDPPSEGSSIEVEFVLPGSDSRLSIRGTVKWFGRNIAPLSSPHRFAFGISFSGVRPNDRAILARYLVDYRPQVVVAYASAAESLLSRDALEPDAQVHDASSEQGLQRLLSRGDVYAVVVFGDDEAKALRAVDHVTNGHPLGKRLDEVAFLGFAPRIVYCAQATPHRLLRLHNEGKLYQSLDRPVSRDWLRLTVKRACEDYAIRSELGRLRHELEREFFRTRSPAERPRSVEDLPLDQMVLESESMRSVLTLIQTVAPHRAHVLLQGPTGTGKELFARALHKLSPRAQGPFVAIDCGVLPETLLESELFGHVEGAFTGSVGDRPGLFQIADGGTLFLDEIENTTPALQSKLLRFIDSGEMRPVGGNKVQRVDVRLVAASNRDLRAEVDASRFRADLFYRLSAFPIDLPPLRERRDDILPLALHFLKGFANSMGRPPPSLSPSAETALKRYDWPGNVRELRNTIERAMLLTAPGHPIVPDVLPKQVLKSLSMPDPVFTESTSLKERVDEFERELIRAALSHHQGVLRKAATELGMNPVTLGRKVKQYGLKAG